MHIEYKYLVGENITYYLVCNSSDWRDKITKTNRIIKKVLSKPLHFFNNKCKKYDITFILTNNKKIKELNKKYRNISTATDVLTFTSTQKIDKREYKRISDIFLSSEYIEMQSKKLKIKFYNNLTHLIIHALLHANGHIHNNIKNTKNMRSIENLILKEFGIVNPYKNLL